jgi:DNA-binding protein H-NS
MEKQMTSSIQELSFEELRTLSREVAALIAKRRHEALERLREEASVLGFTAQELLPSRKKSDTSAKYTDGNGNSWSGKGKRPAWLLQKLAEGLSLEDLAT